MPHLADHDCKDDAHATTHQSLDGDDLPSVAETDAPGKIVIESPARACRYHERGSQYMFESPLAGPETRKQERTHEDQQNAATPTPSDALREDQYPQAYREHRFEVEEEARDVRIRQSETVEERDWTEDPACQDGRTEPKPLRSLNPIGTSFLLR